MPNALAFEPEALILQLRAAGRDELVHYAGAAHRDPVAHQVCIECLADRTAPEATLKTRALKTAWPTGGSRREYTAWSDRVPPVPTAPPAESQAKRSSDLDVYMQTGRWPS